MKDKRDKGKRDEKKREGGTDKMREMVEHRGVDVEGETDRERERERQSKEEK